MTQTLTAEHVRFLVDNGLRRITRRDPALPHQIILNFVKGSAGGQLIGVSCNCMPEIGRSKRIYRQPIEARSSWQPGEAMACWREHVELDAALEAVP